MIWHCKRIWARDEQSLVWKVFILKWKNYLKKKELFDSIISDTSWIALKKLNYIRQCKINNILLIEIYGTRTSFILFQQKHWWCFIGLYFSQAFFRLKFIDLLCKKPIKYKGSFDIDEYKISLNEENKMHFKVSIWFIIIQINICYIIILRKQLQ